MSTKQNWIHHPVILKGNTIDLIPLEAAHLDELYVAAADKELWQQIPTDCSDKETFYTTYLFALKETESGNQYPFVIMHKPTQKLIGSTRLFEIYPKDRKLEIGWPGSQKSFGEPP